MLAYAMTICQRVGICFSGADHDEMNVYDCKIKTWFYSLVSYFTIFIVAPESNRMCPFFVILCLILMSDDANDGISETLHVRQNIGTVLHDVSTDDRTIIRRLEGNV